MPYLTHEQRAKVTRTGNVNTPGKLTFCLQQTIKAYLRRRGLSYDTIAEVFGSLEGCRADFERRVVTPYETHKQVANGDVWEDQE